MPGPAVGIGGKRSPLRTFFTFIIIFTIFSSAFLYLNSLTSIPSLRPQIVRPINIVLWDHKEQPDNWSSFLGPALYANQSVQRFCPFECTFTTNRFNLHLADAVVFNPTVLDPDDWRRIPVTLPHKQPYQQWAVTSFQHEHNYPLTANKLYNSFMDISMTYKQDSDVPVTMFCPWGSAFRKPQDLLETPKSQRDKSILFISSNCVVSGASARTAYVAELMKHIEVDSLGKCLNTNSDWKAYVGKPTLDKIDDTIELMKQYKIVLAFENNNVTDFVTEKLFTVFQAGALPVYMGAPNVDDWLPGSNSIIRTSDYKSPQQLADYLKVLLTDQSEYQKYFQWKKSPLSKNFLQKFDRCFYSAECRLCQKVLAGITEETEEVKSAVAPQRPSGLWQALNMNGHGDYIKVKHHRKLCVTDRYTLMAWVKPLSFGDQRIIDKNKAGTVTGFNFDIQSGEQSRGFVRLCGGDNCYIAKRGIYKNTWSHVAVVYSSEHGTVFENHLDFYINGVLDHSEIVFGPTKQETWYPLTFGKPSSDKPDANTFHGSMDNIIMFERDLSEAEVRHYMYSAPAGDEAGLIGYWPFDEPNDDPIAHDHSLYQFDGEVFGAVREASLTKPLHLGSC